MSKRITVTDLEMQVLSELFQNSLNGYYASDDLSIDESIEKKVIQSVLKKISL